MTDDPQTIGNEGQGADEEESLEEASLISHLIELRSRLVKASLTVLAVFICLVPFAQEIFTMVADPLMAKLPEGSTMIATQVASPFLTPFQTTLFVALFFAMPVVIYQIWAFVAPGRGAAIRSSGCSCAGRCRWRWSRNSTPGARSGISKGPKAGSM